MYRPRRVASLAEAHRQLQNDRADLRRLATRSLQNSAWLASVAEELARLSRTIADLFALQSADGYLEEVEARAPQLHDQVTRLYEEQEAILDEVDRLQADCTAASRRESWPLRNRLLGLLDRIEAHEHRETALVQRAFTIDPGAMD